MTLSPPKIDSRRQADVARQLRAELAARYPGWPDAGGAGNGLVEVFSRYAELVIERTNHVLDRNRVAFLSRLGGALLPPRPATVPLTFALAPGGSIAAVVPAGTQVAAAPAPGSSEPVVFETQSELVVTAATLDRLFVRCAADDQFTDLAPLLTVPAETPIPIYKGTTSLEHHLYIGSDVFFGCQLLNKLSVSLDMEDDLTATKGEVAWEIWTGSQCFPLTPEKDGTAALTHSGDVVFRDLPQFITAKVDTQQKHWLRCRWLTTVFRPSIARTLTLEREIDHAGLLPTVAFTNAIKLDLSKDFQPLGDYPRFGDAFYILNLEAFSVCGAQVTLNVAITNPSAGGDDIPVPRVNATADAKVAWEYWNGRQWCLLGIMSAQSQTGDQNDAFSDTTQAFTASGQVSFTVPQDLQMTDVAGVPGPWIRARLVANGYGEEAGYIVSESKPGTLAYAYKPRTLVAPIVKQIEIGFTIHETGRRADAVLAYNDFAFKDITAALGGVLGDAELFRPSDDPEPALYLGFSPPFKLGMPSLPITVYFVLGGSSPSAGTEDSDVQRTVWQYWNGANWVSFTVTDKTGGFAYSGGITFLVPPGAKASEQFGQARYWLRVPWLVRSGSNTAPLHLALENTILASQTVTLENEVLGSSNGTPDQNFMASRRPVLEGEVLQIRAPVSGADMAARESWTIWQNVTDFHASGPLDQHYVLERISGSITFGDGRRGAIPLRGTGNVRLMRYRTGGGAAGNKGVGTIVQLKTTVPYVRVVTNNEPASGGADAETISAMLERAPRSFRHRSRAVTVEDYEDLAMLASPDIARTRCIPLANLVLDPDAKQKRPGTVSVLVVPRSTGPKPLPSESLLSTVRDYLKDRQSATVQLIVTCPEYVELNVTAEIGVATLDGVTELEAAIRQRLIEFMHPLHGGFDRNGWDFGRHPHRSDLLSLISSVAGVDHIRSLTIQQVEKRTGAAKTPTFLALAGETRLTFTLI